MRTTSWDILAVVSVVAEYTGVDVAAIYGHRRERSTVMARHAAIRLCHTMFGDASITSIARALSKDRTSVEYALELGQRCPSQVVVKQAKAIANACEKAARLRVCRRPASEFLCPLGKTPQLFETVPQPMPYVGCVVVTEYGRSIARMMVS